jgi:2-methylisocitrate lyase-like PEP mutase family enzyme
MTSQHDRAGTFRALHRPGDPLVLVNIWDVGSALAIAETGAPAVATSSWSVARTQGFDDGENLPLDDLLALTRAISTRIPLPLSVDLEGGYGPAPETVGRSVAAVLDAGAVGCNLEDSRPESTPLVPVAEQARRLAAARQAADDAGIPAFVNARTDVFLRQPDAGPAGLDEVVSRAGEYAANGADGLFVPGLTDLDLIENLVERSPLPVNIMVDGTQPLESLSATGVARISFGAASYLAATAALVSLAGSTPRPSVDA